MNDLEERVAEAVRVFWGTRASQREEQRAEDADRGSRSDVLGGKQMDGFADLISSLLVEEGVPRDAIHYNRAAEIPGYFRATKAWDLIVVMEGALWVAIELKSQVGPSFGNNANNRTEEALGNAADLHAAHREGVFGSEAPPWMGYLMLLEESEGSTTPVQVREPHYPVLPDFTNASYAERYEILCSRLVEEDLYDASALILTPRDAGREGAHREPDESIGFYKFTESLLEHIGRRLNS